MSNEASDEGKTMTEDEDIHTPERWHATEAHRSGLSGLRELVTTMCNEENIHTPEGVGCGGMICSDSGCRFCKHGGRPTDCVMCHGSGQQDMGEGKSRPCPVCEIREKLQKASDDRRAAQTECHDDAELKLSSAAYEERQRRMSELARALERFTPEAQLAATQALLKNALRELDEVRRKLDLAMRHMNRDQRGTFEEALAEEKAEPR